MEAQGGHLEGLQMGTQERQEAVACHVGAPL